MNSKQIYDVYMSTKCNNIDAIRRKKRSWKPDKTLCETLGTPSPALVDMAPIYSMLIQFTFHLASPYLSKDDDPLYDDKQEIRREKIFQWPMVSPSSWKGHLRWAAQREAIAQSLSEPEKIISGIFGNERKEKEHFSRGRLNFFPTFFNHECGHELINPHKRGTKAGTKPITIECMPAKAKGIFSLMYVPFDLMGWEAKDKRKQVNMDVYLILDAIDAMMLKYGFSAKRTTGYGIILPVTTGFLNFRDKNEFVSIRWKDKSIKDVFEVIKNNYGFEGRGHEPA